MQQDKSLQMELDRAKIALMKDKESVFFTTIVLSLKFQWDDTIPTAATNGHQLKINPAFFMKATKEQRVFVMVHEACHVAYDHMGRKGNKDMQLWNKAADHVINLMIKDRINKQQIKTMEMWPWVLCDSRFEGMSAEQVYRVLETEQCQEPNPMEDIQMPSEDDGTGNGSNKPMDAVAHQRHIEKIIMRAATQAQMAGKGAGSGAIPGDIELFLQGLLRPRLPWKKLLRREVGQTAKNGYTWVRPNRRFHPQIYLPSMYSQEPAELTCYVDISGSVTDAQFNIFVSEISAALRMFNLQKVRIVQFDTQIQHDDTVNSIQALSKIKFNGRGGTYIVPVFEHINKYKPKLSAIFTDGDFRMPAEIVKHRILWLINDNEHFTAPFGTVTHFKTD